jgi:RNA polymerase sigma-B factor
MAVAMSADALRALGIAAEFEAYRLNRSIENRDALIMRDAPLVRSVAGHFGRALVERDDLEQVGYVGLIKAVERFDSSLGVPFEAYARTIVGGEISHYVRDLVPTMRVPRWYGNLNRRLHQSRDRLESALQREPTVFELADDMNVTPEGVREILALRAQYNLMSLTDHSSEREPAIDRIRSRRYENFHLPIEDRIVLDRAIERLAAFERNVVDLFFYQDLTQTEIAKRLGFSQKHISRILAATLAKLRADIH